MPEDEVDILIQKIGLTEEHLKVSRAKGDENEADFLAAKLALLKTEAKYLLAGGNSLESPDVLAQIDFVLSKKKALLAELERNINNLPDNYIELAKYRRIEKILSAQIEYLSAKHRVIAENRRLSELGIYIQLAEENGVDIVPSALEHEAELDRFKPKKREKRKKELVIDFRMVAVVLIVFLLIFSIYLGAFWRKTPYDREIIRSYVIARNHYIAGNNYYTQGEYLGAVKEYATAAAFFNQAKETADLAASSRSGKMNIYFQNKGRFFAVWEEVSRKMIESSEQSLYGDPELAVKAVEDAVDLAGIANNYNDLAEEAWRLL
ncbi:MAG TPA: hypothetical protein ENH13_01615 [Euryarchaeota archaeon]|nr:hypothetical protein BMS3Abin16_01862 [archaeon BMS3Abin16]HDH27811.1 hypothetical protein [Euryarchaeota archaeon]HDY73844.1 hypothetical protein [Euryarchaeota archaeon]